MGWTLNEIFWLAKKDGFTTVKRASEDELLRSLFAGGRLTGRALETRLIRGSWIAMSRIVFLLEEGSIKVLLEGLLPRLFPGLPFLCVSHEGKRDLELSIPRKLKAWREPGVRFVVMRDQNSGDCHQVKDLVSSNYASSLDDVTFLVRNCLPGVGSMVRGRARSPSSSISPGPAKLATRIGTGADTRTPIPSFALPIPSPE